MTDMPDAEKVKDTACLQSAGSQSGVRRLDVLPTRPLRSRHPSWIKSRFAAGERYHFLKKILRQKGLHTVCEEAACPNVGECWSHGTATFMLMGDTCTRGCTFCAVGKGKPSELDPREPDAIFERVEKFLGDSPP